jgi:hypothetical protein
MADSAQLSLFFEMLERGGGGDRRGVYLYCLPIAILQPGYADSLILLYAVAADAALLRDCNSLLCV